MIPSHVRIFVCTEPVDMRRWFDGLALAARERLGKEPREGGLRLREQALEQAQDERVGQSSSGSSRGPGRSGVRRRSPGARRSGPGDVAARFPLTGALSAAYFAGAERGPCR